MVLGAPANLSINLIAISQVFLVLLRNLSSQRVEDGLVLLSGVFGLFGGWIGGGKSTLGADQSLCDCETVECCGECEILRGMGR